MASSLSQLTSQPLQSNSAFNFVFLIEWITIGILTVWFLFYFNRVLATIISYALRLYTWHKLGVYVDIEALQISLLAGRIFFKGVHYHGDNETIHIHGGYITWRYWLRRVKEAAIFDAAPPHKNAPETESETPTDSSEDGPVHDVEDGSRLGTNKELPCRIEVKISGVEAFIYNRGPGYDFIIDNINKHQEHTRQRASSQSSPDSPAARFRSAADPSTAAPSRTTTKSNDFRGTSEVSSLPASPSASTAASSSPPIFLRLLPISVECNKAAAVLGNENTPSIITAKIDGATGTFDAGAAGELDLFKILMSFNAKKPFIQMKPNIDYKRPQLAEATILKQTANPTGQIAKPRSRFSRRGLYGPLRLNFGWTKYIGLSKKASASLESVVNLAQLSTDDEKLPDAVPPAVPGQARWIGLSRYLDDEQHDERDEWENVEYAKSSTIAELEAVTFKMFWDIPGHRPLADHEHGNSPIRDINGSKPPDYGMEIAVHGGQIAYGPWADRHRLILQQLFFPASFVDMHPTPRVKPGEARINSKFDLLLRIEGDTVLRVPFKEPSRDWRWKGRAAAVSGQTKRADGGGGSTGKSRSRRRKDKRGHPEKSGQATDARPYAWFDIKVLAGSTISYNMDVYPYPDGYRNRLNLDVKGLEMYSSLNHALLWRSNGVSLKANLPYTLTWNALREWVFEIGIQDLELFLLRDHTFLLVDLIEDWTTGPLPSFLTFVPYKYILKTHFDNFKMFLNVNDANIVDSSDDLDDNDFIILGGRTLDADLTIPLDRFRPAQSEIRFDVVGQDLSLELSMPPKNTLNALLANKNVAKLPSVILHGTYGMSTEVRPGLTDTLHMDIVGDGLRIAFYGFFARQLAKIKDNYFGEQMHFRTNEEFQELLARPGVQPHGIVQNSTKSNDLDVILDIVATDAVILLPAGLYNCDDFFDLRVDRADVDLRVNNYYLELSVDSNPLHVGHNTQVLSLHEFETSKSSPQIVIDGVNVFGHRLFGLSPSEPAYVSSWDIDAGDILGDMSCDFLAKVVSGAQALALTITDEENGLPLPDEDPIFDMTAVRFQCSLVRLWLRVVDVAFLANINNVAGTFHDRNTQLFSQQLDMTVPDIHVACIENVTLVEHRDKMTSWRSDAYAFFQTSLSLKMLQRNPNFEENRQAQHDHIARHDVKGQRAQFLLPQSYRSNQSPHVASLCLPKLPGPLEGNEQFRSEQLHDTSLNDHVSQTSSTFATAGMDPEATFASGSVYSKPSLPLDGIQIDLQDVPKAPPGMKQASPSNPSGLSNMFNGDLDNDSIHTSLIVQTQPIVLMCKPKAIKAVSDILDSTVAKDPAGVFDLYQMATVQEVISVLTRNRGKKTILDISLRIPFLHARVINPLQEGSERIVGDEYNFTSQTVSTMLRVKNSPDQKTSSGFKAVHLTATSLCLFARKRIRGGRNTPVAFKTGLDDLLLWVADSDRTSVRATFRNLEVLFTGTDVQYLASLVHRTTLLADALQAPFSNLALQNDQRRRFVVYHLTRLGDDVGDPSFLTRPSYMIRSAKDHLRNSDSWKIIARLRWVLLKLSQAERDSLTKQCCEGDIELPNDAESSILAALDHWRAWDAINVQESIAMRLLFNSGIGATKLQDRSTIPVAVVLQAASISIKIDHGAKLNEVLLDGMALAVAITPPPPPSAMQIFHEYQESRMTAIQVNTSRAAINLKWEVCELIESIMTLFQEQAPGQHSKSILTATKTQTWVRGSGPKKEEIHVVFAADSADVNLETITIVQTFNSSGLKISVVGQNEAEMPLAFTFNAAASARSASMTMYKGMNRLWSSGVMMPALVASYSSSPVGEEHLQEIHIAGDCSELQFDFKEDLLGLLEVVNLIISQEARYLKELAQKFVIPLDASPSLPSESQPPKIKVNLALFLKQYYFRLSLHPNLHYLTEGRVARMVLNPSDISGADTYRANFDLEGQAHHILTGSVGKPDTTSTIDMAPINGTVQLSIYPKQISTSALVTMELIRIEGAALYGIMAAISTPAATSALDSIKKDFDAILSAAKNLFSTSKEAQISPTPSKDQSRHIAFDASLILAGFSVAAHAPTQSRSQPTADILFTLGATRLRASNRSLTDELVLPLPEFSLVLGDIDAVIRRDMSQTGCASLAIKLACTMTLEDDGSFKQHFVLSATGPVITVDAETAPAIIDIVAHFQHLLKDLDLSREKRYFRRLRHPEESKLGQRVPIPAAWPQNSNTARIKPSFTFDIQSIQVCYAVGGHSPRDNRGSAQDLVLSLASVNLLTRSEREARLKIDGLQLQFVRTGQPKVRRTANSALLPELIFNVSFNNAEEGRRLAFRAAGKALDLQMDPHIVIPIDRLKRSIARSLAKSKLALGSLRAAPANTTATQKNMLLGQRRISYVFVNTQFAGAVIRLEGAKDLAQDGQSQAHKIRGHTHEGRFGQFLNDSSSTSATLRAPGIAFRIRYEDFADKDSSLNVEVRVDGSNNSLTPSVVPLVLEIFHNIKDTMRDSDAEHSSPVLASTEPQTEAQSGPQVLTGDDALVQADPKIVLGHTRLNFGFRICKQEFTMTCQPIAKVAAKAKLEDIYIAVNTVDTNENGSFFAISVAFSGLQASLQHVYSREATFVFDIESIILSMMNSKHISGTTGISAILRINPMKAQLNAKQFQDLLLFREIWLPAEIRHSATQYQASSGSESQDYFVSRYRQIAASTAFPWNATLAIADLSIEVDLGQAIGKLSSRITDLWASSKKTTKSQQTLCFGIENVSIDSSGRTSGYVKLNKVKVRTSIAWPIEAEGYETPLVQGSIGFHELRLKAAFDYQTFAIAHINNFEFIMYNVRDAEQHQNSDRLVAILDGDKIHVYCVAASAALAVSLVQALERLLQEKKTSYSQSLQDIETFLRRKLPAAPTARSAKSAQSQKADTAVPSGKLPISLQTDVVVTLGSVNVGAFPRTIVDSQLLKLEAANVQARFAVALDEDKIHSGLGLTLGKVSAALAAAPQQTIPSALSEISVEQVTRSAAAARGGVILRVPRVVAAMQTWQGNESKAIDYVFKSTFEGKIDVGWNYSRISFIRSMWETHSRTLASRLGRPLPQSALKITAPQTVVENSAAEQDILDAMKPREDRQKITAEVHLPQSTYTYRALQPPIIDTPQLRDMGEATPPLEWIGLHRDRLPNVTHQVVIVTLLEVAKEVEDAYSRILGSAK